MLVCIKDPPQPSTALGARKPRPDEIAREVYQPPVIHPSNKFLTRDGLMETTLPRPMSPQTGSDFDMLRKDKESRSEGPWMWTMALGGSRFLTIDLFTGRVLHSHRV